MKMLGMIWLLEVDELVVATAAGVDGAVVPGGGGGGGGGGGCKWMTC